MKRNIKLTLAAALLAAFASDGASSLTGLKGLSLVSSAEAVVGRPLTPVSVAGVARRSNRR
jgi:hypothetical protein